MTTELVEQWYTSLIDELQDIITETGFTSRWALIEGYHQVGTRILQENDNFERSQIYGEGICNAIAESLQKRPRTIYYAIQFAREYPDLNLLNEGKNISWWKVINKYLTKGKKKDDECIHNPTVICSVCKKKLGMEEFDKYQCSVLELQIKEIKELLTTGWRMYEPDKERIIMQFDIARAEGMIHSKDGEHSESSIRAAEDAIDLLEIAVIRYLQDQVDKITSEALGGSE